jgi:hypothetical protein
MSGVPSHPTPRAIATIFTVKPGASYWTAGLALSLPLLAQGPSAGYTSTARRRSNLSRNVPSRQSPPKRRNPPKLAFPRSRR